MQRPKDASKNDTPHLLIVDDDLDLCDVLTRYLEAEDFRVSSAHTGSEGSKAGIEGSYELIVLDVMLPDKKGFDVLRELRERARTPVLMLTAKGDEFDRVLGLQMGADDYLAKPFSPRELIARIGAILRRSGWQSEQGNPQRPLSIRSGDFGLDLAGRSASRSGQFLHLTSAEFDFLRAFLASAQ